MSLVRGFNSISRSVAAVMVQLLLDLPEDMTLAVWGYIVIRIMMGVVQGIEQSAKVKT